LLRIAQKLIENKIKVKIIKDHQNMEDLKNIIIIHQTIKNLIQTILIKIIIIDKPVNKIQIIRQKT
jgi:hypothetical protein